MLPPLGWGLWAIAAAGLIPALARSLETRMAHVGDALASGRLAPALIATVLIAAWVAGSADNARFVGDFLLRQGTVEQSGSPAVLFPQALPLDVLIHYTLPAALRKADLLSANGTARVIGMVNAALLTWLACGFVRVLGLRGAAALAAWSVVVFGGYLGMFTGYSKSLAELVMVALALAVSGVRLAREGRGALALGVTLAIGFSLHRAATVFLIPAAVAWGFGARRLDRAAWRRPATLLAIALPIAALAVSTPRIVSTVLHVDAAVHLAPVAVRRVGVLAAAFAGPRLADFLNLALLLSPVALAALAAVLAGRTAPRASAAPPDQGAGERAVLLALALPLALIAPFIHPAQGLFRDWDDFAATGMTLSLISALALGRLLARAGARRWVAVTVVAAAFSATAQWLAINASADESLARARAIATEPPARDESERAGLWDYLGIRNFRLGRWPESAEAFSHAAEYAPSPRMLQEWAMAETMAGHLREAQQVYHRLIEKDPRNKSAWLGLGSVASRIPDVDEAFLGAEKVLELDPGDVTGRQLMDYLRKTYPSHP
jgi:tetratricopeptide (TPR) repeat protein